MEIREKVLGYVNENLLFMDEERSFTDTDDIFELGFVNSLFAMKLLMFIEQEFGIVVENDDMDLSNFNSISNIVQFIEGKIKVSQ